eukprot:CAMPEP_0194212610 /NCGR_PEP_ID=MMETSP0156-20130528/12662_1 /TAXON_ID=33649 /ORGANISM="Thalassionema nitzschioides, Strain L26-B" /LENGTH=285 /DNA_ID=CAMNT_0038940481 /DNA_START=132 /DNA_END=989 /DNA_ORIENTATION=+
MAEEATINPDGTQEMPPMDEPPLEEEIPIDEEMVKEAMGGLDPVYYLIIGTIIVMLLVYLFRPKKSEVEDFFDELDGDKFNLKLPAAVEEYYQVKDKCLDAGWEPGTAPTPGQQQAANGPHRVMAQALMKRCIADIPIVTHIQKESPGMNKLYSQSMCSVKQWRTYQAAEALVSGEVDEVRAEADEIEPGWSQVIWKQAMQYHNMLKQKHEQEAQQVAAAAVKKKEIESVKNAEKKKVDDAKAREKAAEEAAKELLKMEEREKKAKKAFKEGGAMKKGFLSSGKK